MLALALGRAAMMARIPAGLPAGIRVSDHVSLGVIARAFPPDEVRQVLAETGKASERERDLPAHVVVYYAIALALRTTSGTRVNASVQMRPPDPISCPLPRIELPSICPRSCLNGSTASARTTCDHSRSPC